MVLRPGAEVVLVSTGTQTSRTMDACHRLIQAGFEVGLVHVPFLKPLDTSSLYEAIRHSRLVVSVEEHTTIGGLGGAVAEVIAEKGGPRLRRIGIDDVFGESGTNDDLLERFGLSPASIVERVQAWMDGN